LKIFSKLFVILFSWFWGGSKSLLQHSIIHSLLCVSLWNIHSGSLLPLEEISKSLIQVIFHSWIKCNHSNSTRKSLSKSLSSHDLKNPSNHLIFFKFSRKDKCFLDNSLIAFRIVYFPNLSIYSFTNFLSPLCRISTRASSILIQSVASSWNWVCCFPGLLILKKVVFFRRFLSRTTQIFSPSLKS